eukprot:gene21044-19666_t
MPDVGTAGRAPSAPQHGARPRPGCRDDWLAATAGRGAGAPP